MQGGHHRGEPGDFDLGRHAGGIGMRGRRPDIQNVSAIGQKIVGMRQCGPGREEFSAVGK